MIYQKKVTIIEVLPKEKKQKDEKVQTFGQSTFNLYEVLKGKTEFSLKLPVYATPGSTLETQPSDTVLVFEFKLTFLRIFLDLGEFTHVTYTL